MSLLLLFKRQQTLRSCKGIKMCGLPDAYLQTMYLANKLGKLQDKIDIISQDIHSQNAIYFIGKLTEYFGIVESARVLLLDKDLTTESKDIANIYLSEMAIKRNELFSLVDNFIGLLDNMSERHTDLMLDFINTLLDIMPKGIYIENQLYESQGKFKMADHILKISSMRYKKTLFSYGEFCKKKTKSIILSEDVKHVKLFQDNEINFKKISKSEYNVALLHKGTLKLDLN
ncbi:hypothetical protein [Marinomonas sp. IMCC 4694]|uniref:hypothetical protein n=1 Tax=Marinomonas sp. IMCC 4694 TaxID=2605432 RepID=UPI0011E85FF1|nr:hypothetical protein [Marinomonas sp. IMCC 4694]TYL47313.1 hypothetical protein FXV75_04720 [Marinomonas sp. IMCC 4694]